MNNTYPVRNDSFNAGKTCYMLSGAETENMHPKDPDHNLDCFRAGARSIAFRDGFELAMNDYKYNKEMTPEEMENYWGPFRDGYNSMMKTLRKIA